MSYHPIESIDYIDDYFSFLDMDDDALLLALSVEGLLDPKNDEFLSLVKASYYRLATSYHPDKVSNAWLELQAIAIRRFQQIQTANETLADFTKRTDYLVKYLTFDGYLPSKDGNPIINFSKQIIDIDFLLSGNEAQIDSEIEAHAKVLSGFNEAVFAVVKTQYESTPAPSSDLREAYLSQLIAKNAFYAVKEEFAWGKAGVINKQVCNVIEDTNIYLDTVHEDINKTKEEIICKSKLIVEQIAHNSGRKLLLGNDEILQGSLDNLSLEKIEDTANAVAIAASESFEGKVAEIKRIAEERARIQSSIIDLTKASYLNEEGELKQLFILLSFDNKVVNMALVFDFTNFPEIDSERFTLLDNFPIPLESPLTHIPVVILHVSPEVHCDVLSF